MNELDDEELALLGDFKKGKLKSAATKGELTKFKVAAHATAIKDRRMTRLRSHAGSHRRRRRAIDAPPN